MDASIREIHPVSLFRGGEPLLSFSVVASSPEQIFLSAFSAPKLSPVLAKLKGLANPARAEKMLPLKWTVFSMCVLLVLRSAPLFSPAASSFHSINSSAGQKELVYTPDFLIWFDAQWCGRCSNFKGEERE